MEQEALGTAGQKLTDAASSAGEKLSSAASAASERLMSAAEERGVSAGGLKEVARDVAGTFEKSLSGDDKDKSAPGQASTATGGRSVTAKDRPGNR
jgi:hypothetical protein